MVADVPVALWPMQVSGTGVGIGAQDDALLVQQFYIQAGNLRFQWADGTAAWFTPLPALQPT